MRLWSVEIYALKRLNIDYNVEHKVDAGTNLHALNLQDAKLHTQIKLAHCTLYSLISN